MLFCSDLVFLPFLYLDFPEAPNDEKGKFFCFVAVNIYAMSRSRLSLSKVAIFVLVRFLIGVLFLIRRYTTDLQR